MILRVLSVAGSVLIYLTAFAWLPAPQAWGFCALCVGVKLVDRMLGARDAKGWM